MLMFKKSLDMPGKDQALPAGPIRSRPRLNISSTATR